jgi:hypothetical protein
LSSFILNVEAAIDGHSPQAIHLSLSIFGIFINEISE